MNVELNSVWKVSNIDGLHAGLYRVIRVLSALDVFILFEIFRSNKKITRPVLCNFYDFINGIKNKEITREKFSLPEHLLLSDETIPESHLREREERYSLIECLVDDDILYFDLATKRRIKKISDHAKSVEKPVQTIYRYLNLFWRYGQDPSVLTPAFAMRGGKGGIKKSGKSKRGARVESIFNALETNPGINITEEDRKKISKGVDKFYLIKTNKSLKEAYKDTLKEYYSEQIVKAELENTFAKIPTYQQFRYWKNRLFDVQEVIKNRTTELDYLKNKRGLLGSASEKSPIPGDCFEIDATVADVHIVSSFQPRKPLARPTIYIVVDRASRMIVGLHVSWEYCSWSAARQALVNSFLPKANYCRKYGIPIAEADWPCSHIPRRLLCDRGEMICSQPEKVVVPLTQLDIAPPYRADAKGIVERRFKILNDTVLHQLIGTTRGKMYVRGDGNPRNKALYTIDEVTELLILEVLEHNKQQFEELALSSNLLIGNNLPPTPINFWNIHLAKQRHALKVAEEEEIRALLLPAVQVTVTRSGVKYKDMYYSCERMVQEDWFSIARTEGRWRLEARIDYDNSSFIFVRLRDGGRLVKCDLLSRSKMFKDLPNADIIYFQEWKRSMEQRSSITSSSIKSHERKKQIKTEAHKSKKMAPAQKVVENIREDRRKEILFEKRKNSEDGNQYVKADNDLIVDKDTSNNSIMKNKNSRLLKILNRNGRP